MLCFLIPSKITRTSNKARSMDHYGYHDGNIYNLLDSRQFNRRSNGKKGLQLHSSLIRRFYLETELQGHQGCVNTIAWNSTGSLLLSGSDDTRMNIWSYSRRKLEHSIDTGHSANIFCTKFVPETSDERAVSGAGDGEVRLFDVHRSVGRNSDDTMGDLSAVYRCHSRRVKKLAVEAGNPNVVWSASEDGTLRQHDFREITCCPPVGSSPQACRSILLDLRSGAKRSIADPPKHTLALKSCDISANRPHLLIVGGSDAFARLYDRRMLPPLSSCRKFSPPPPIVSYVCPMHLSESGRSSLHLTHVTFNSYGDEVLLSYSGEHVYLMNVDSAGKRAMQYSSGDPSKLMTFTPSLNGLHLDSASSDVYKGGQCNVSVSSTLDKCRNLLEFAQQCLQEDRDYFNGVEACNEILDTHHRIVDSSLRHKCLCTRAALFLKRKWKNDAHMAIRDCYNARRLDSSSFRALYYMSQALSQLGKYKEALDFAVSAQSVAPPGTALCEWIETIKKNSVSDENNKVRCEGRSVRALSLSDILFRSESNSDASQEGDRDDSDYDEDFGLELETSISDHEGMDIENEGNSTLKMSQSESSGFTNSLPYQCEAVIDMNQRYVGHCNVGTDIKQANFLGQKGEYVASGSDNGKWFIWEKQTGRLVNMLIGDKAVVNCVQSHPFDSVVATSGIDDTIKIWGPSATGVPETENFLEAMEAHQRRLNHTREFVLPFELFERSRMLEFTEGTLHPFECTQS